MEVDRGIMLEAIAKLRAGRMFEAACSLHSLMDEVDMRMGAVALVALEWRGCGGEHAEFRYVPIIKQVRSDYGAGLADAKAAVDAAMHTLGIPRKAPEA